MSDDAPAVDVEWRVTGDPGEGFPPYVYTWRGPDAEERARGFARLAGTVERWRDGPRLHRRTVTYTPWQQEPITPTTESDHR